MPPKRRSRPLELEDPSAQFNFTIDETNIGETIGPPDGYLVNLIMTTPPNNNSPPRWDEGRGQWLSRYLQIRGSRDVRDLYCNDPTNGHAFSWWGDTATACSNMSLGYRGDLMVVCVPKGSVWNLTLSDQPIVRAREQPFWNFSGSNYKPVNPPGSAEGAAGR